MKTDPRSWIDLCACLRDLSRRRACNAAHARERGFPFWVDIRKANAEGAASVLILAPHDGGVGNNLLTVPIEAANQGLSDVRQIGRAQVHSLRGHIDPLGLECGALSAAPKLDEGVEWNPLVVRVAPVLMNAHRFLQKN